MRFEEILEWYSGKARETIVNFTIPAIVESETLGYWKKGVARTVRATLNKQNVAAKLARKIEKDLGESSFGSVRLRHDHPLNEVQTNMLYGSFGHAPRTLQALLAVPSFNDAAKLYVEDAIRWAKAFAPVAHLVQLLDERRPKPTVVMKTLSPTVAKTVSEHIGIDVSTIQTPPMHGEWVEFVYKGQKCRVWEVVVDWPDGTLHNRSRFLHSENHDQCQACGHAIKNPFNWWPILAYGPEPLDQQLVDVAPKTVPYSLWVGRDCAAKLFGCEIDGDSIYKR